MRDEKLRWWSARSRHTWNGDFLRGDVIDDRRRSDDSPEPMTSNVSNDLQSALAVIDGITQAWNAADARRYAAHFTEDCRYIAFFGGIYAGREEVAVSHALLFEGPLKNTRMFYDILDFRLIGDQLALILTTGDVAKERPTTFTKVQSYVLTRVGAAWQITQFQNTRRQRMMRWLTYKAGRDAIPSLLR